MCAYHGVINVSFLENFCKRTKWMILYYACLFFREAWARIKFNATKAVTSVVCNPFFWERIVIRVIFKLKFWKLGKFSQKSKSDSHLPKKKFFFICFNDSPSKMIKNAFYFILKAIFILKVFRFFLDFLGIQNKRLD